MILHIRMLDAEILIIIPNFHSRELRPFNPELSSTARGENYSLSATFLRHHVCKFCTSVGVPDETCNLILHVLFLGSRRPIRCNKDCCIYLRRNGSARAPDQYGSHNQVREESAVENAERHFLTDEAWPSSKTGAAKIPL